jgi:hypothetical protein
MGEHIEVLVVEIASAGTDARSRRCWSRDPGSDWGKDFGLAGSLHLLVRILEGGIG